MADLTTQITEIRERLPDLIRSGGQNGLTTADDVRQHEFSVLDVLDALAVLSRGNRIWAFDLGGLTPSENGEWQEGDLYLDTGGLLPGGNLWQFVDGQWVLALNLRGRDGSQLLGGFAPPTGGQGNLGDWYFQYNVAAYEKLAGGWSYRFALGSGLPLQNGQAGKVLGTDGTTASWVAPASGLPSQAGQAGKVLRTDGTTASWSDSAVGTLASLLTTAKSSAVAAINELFGLVSTNTTSIGTLSALATTVKSTLVAAINELVAGLTTTNSNVGTLSSLNTTNKGNLVGAINEVRGILPITSERTTAYPLALADVGCLVPVNGSAAVIITVPASATVAWPLGAIIQVRQRGTGAVSLAFAAGVTVNAYPSGATKCAGQHAEIGLHYIGGDVWNLASATI